MMHYTMKLLILTAVIKKEGLPTAMDNPYSWM